jgi:hypothetical protein
MVAIGRAGHGPEQPRHVSPPGYPGPRRLACVAWPASPPWQDVGERLPVRLAHDIAAGNPVGGPGRGEAAGRHPRIMGLDRARLGKGRSAAPERWEAASLPVGRTVHESRNGRGTFRPPGRRRVGRRQL